jgi:hypothetical protein
MAYCVQPPWLAKISATDNHGTVRTASVPCRDAGYFAVDLIASGFPVDTLPLPYERRRECRAISLDEPTSPPL